ELEKEVRDTKAYEAIKAGNLQEAQRRLNQAADVDAILLEYSRGDEDFSHALSALRADRNHGLVPLIVLIPDLPPDQEMALRRFVQRHRHVYLHPLKVTQLAENFKKVLDDRIGETMTRAFTAAERKEYAKKSLEWLNKLVRGEVPGYELRKGEDTALLESLLTILRSPERTKELGGVVIDMVARHPGRKTQRGLADFIINTANDPKLRVQAATELNFHVQRNGLYLGAEELRDLRDQERATKDEALKTKISLLFGTLKAADAKQTGRTLIGIPEK